VRWGDSGDGRANKKKARLDCFVARARNDELSGFRQLFNVIASEAKQSRATQEDWIACSKRKTPERDVESDPGVAMTA
jgi:hypothetical protein